MNRTRFFIMRGFTVVEALVALSCTTIIFLALQSFFSHGVKSSLKGQDNLETIRAASQLFYEMRKDLLACQKIVVPDPASCVISVGDPSIPPIPAGATEISFCTREATTTYALKTRPDGKALVNRSVFIANSLSNTREFAVPRLLSFKAQQIWKIQQIFAGGTFKEGQVLVEVEIDSKDKRFPSKNFKMTSFFITSQLSSSNWNYFY